MPVVTIPTTAGITLSDWVSETKRHLLAGTVEEQTSLLVALGTTDTVVYVDPSVPLGGLVQGSTFEIDQELFYVRTADPANHLLTVRRAQNGSVAAGHSADAVIRVKPRFPHFAVVKALSVAVNDLSATNLYSVGTVTLTYTPSVFGYDLGISNINDIISIRVPLQGVENIWPELTDYQLDNNANTTTFPSGRALYLYQSPLNQGDPIQVTYRADFVPLVNLTDDVSATGLPGSGYDLPPIGAALHLMAGRPIKRSFTEAQGDTRRAGEVPPGAVDSSMTQLQRYYARRISSEVTTLTNKYPLQRKQYKTVSGRNTRWR